MYESSNICMRRSRKFSQGGGGGGGQSPRSGLTENFNMANINNLAFPGGGGSGPPVPSSVSAHDMFRLFVFPSCSVFLYGRTTAEA